MTEPAPSWSLSARWVFPVSGPPLPGGIVTIAGERIVRVEPHGARRPDLDLGDAAVLPGLVNAHTHLDLTGLRGAVPFRGDFTDWLRAVIRHRRARSAEQVEADVRVGLAESVRHGVTLLGDISAGGLSWPILASGAVRAVVFHELLGLARERAEAALTAATVWLAAQPATPTCRPGLSPHAPYSVRDDLFERAGLLAQRTNVPLAVHLAETRAELELLEHHSGPFVAFLQELGVWDAEGLSADLQRIVNRCEQHGPHLFVHGNYLPAELRLPRDAAIVYCPRTHAFFGHPPHPFRDLLARGVRVALGTDSLASNPDLDLLAEARFLHRLHPDLPGATLLRLATLAGAEALGWADETGSLQPGKSADLVVVPLPARAAVADAGHREAVAPDPHDLVLASAAPVARVLCRGRWLP
jgi:cytosine/adenosine deaminase-related metal-dependent hydrolase